MKNILFMFKKNWSIIVIVFLWFLFSSPYFLKGLVPFPSKYLVTYFPPWNASYGMAFKNNAMPDVITQIYPWKALTIDTWKHGEIPLWNPYSFSGTVHAGNYQTAVFSPFNLLFFILPFIDAWSVLILLQPLLAGIFSYIFLKEIRCKDIGALIGSIGFMFCGFLVTWMAYGTLGYAVLFLPLILWSITRYVRTGSGFALTIGALAMMCSFYSGHFQISVYVLLTSVFYVLFETISSRKVKEGLKLLVMLGIGVLLSMPQLLLTYDAFRSSVRSASIQMKEVIPWQYIMTFISPDFYGNPVTRNDWFGHYAEWGGYVGIVPLLLSFFAVCYSRHEKKIFFILLGIISLLFAYMSPLSAALFSMKIPVLSTSAASRIIVLTSFSLTVLSAFGFERLVESWNKSEWKKIILFASGILLILAFIWMWVLVGKPFTSERLLIAKRNLILPSVFIMTSLLFFGIGLVRFKHVFVLIVSGFILLSGIDSYRFASKWMPFDPKEFMYPDVKFVDFFKKEIGDSRIFGNISNEVGSYFHIPLIEGYDAMYQARYGEFINAVSGGIVSRSAGSVVQFDKGARYALPMFQILSVKYVLHRLSDGKNVWVFPHWLYPETFVTRYRDEHYEVFENKDVFPRIFLAHTYEVKTDNQEIIDRLFDKDFDRRNSILLETAPPIIPERGDGTIQVLKNSANSLSIKVETSGPKLLFRSETFDPGWIAIIDGIRTPVLRANYDFQAIAVPPGSHVIQFRYVPKSLTYGLYAFVLGLGLLTGIVVLEKRKKKI